jgi:hypothetical protein
MPFDFDQNNNDFSLFDVHPENLQKFFMDIIEHLNSFNYSFKIDCKNLDLLTYSDNDNDVCAFIKENHSYNYYICIKSTHIRDMANITNTSDLPGFFEISINSFYVNMLMVQGINFDLKFLRDNHVDTHTTHVDVHNQIPKHEPFFNIKPFVQPFLISHIRRWKLNIPDETIQFIDYMLEAIKFNIEITEDEYLRFEELTEENNPNQYTLTYLMHACYKKGNIKITLI